MFVLFGRRASEKRRESLRDVTNRDRNNQGEERRRKRGRKASTHACSYVGGLWPVSHIIEQSPCHSSSDIPVAVTPFKNCNNKKILCLILFCPFLLLSFPSPLLCPAVCSLLPSLESVLGLRLSHYSFIMMHCMSLATKLF